MGRSRWLPTCSSGPTSGSSRRWCACSRSDPRWYFRSPVTGSRPARFPYTRPPLWARMSTRALGTVARKKEEGNSPVRRRLRLAVLIALFTLGVFPHASAPAAAAPPVSGHIVAREVADEPVARAAVLSVGSTGGAELPQYTSPVIAAGQLFDRLGVHWTEQPGISDPIAIDLRTSADGATWSEWTAAGDD